MTVIIRPRRSRSAAAYSRQTFPWTICRSVCLSVQCIAEKTADRIRMPFGITGRTRTGPGMRQVVGFGIGPREGVLLGANLGRAIVTSGDFTAYVCDNASTVGAAVWGVACGGPRHCCITWGPRRARGRGGFGGFCSPFSQLEMPLGRRRWNVADSYAKIWQPSQHTARNIIPMHISIFSMSP